MSEGLRETDAYILFELAGATYALSSEEIQQLDMVGTITPVPNAAPYVRGVLSVRGQVIPAVDLRTRFGFPSIDPTLRSRLLVMRTATRTIGLLVDTAREFIRIAPDAIQPPPDGIGELSGRYLRGMAHIGDRLVLVLDPTELLNEAEDPMPAGAPPAGD